MKRKILILSLVFFVLFIPLTVKGFNFNNDENSSNIKADIIKAEINSNYIFDMTVNDVTEIFGRPSKTYKTSVYSYDDKVTYDGKSIYYTNSGLSFHFNHKKKEERELCNEVSIKFVDLKEDSEYGK